MAMAAPLAANAARSVATKAAGSAGSRGAAAAAGKSGGKAAALAGAVADGGGGGGGGKGTSSSAGRPWKQPQRAKGKPVSLGTGSQATYRKALIAEFLICLVLLAFSPLAKKPGEMGPVRFMKRGTATAALFVVLGLVSSAGAGAAKASAAFGGLVTLVLLVDQREAFGKLSEILTDPDDEAEDAQSSLGPPTDEDTGGADFPDVVET